MRAVDVIVKKRDGGELTREEIEFFIEGFNRGEIPDYQAAAWAMAVLLQGMTERETTDLTLAMARSGEQIDLSSVVPFAVDKHSTGGVGDKTTLVVQPVVAACGVPVGKISGKGLGFSGGTLDKMEAIPGFRADLTTEQFLAQLSSIGLVLSGQTADLTPADGKLYALRDVTGTIPSIPLIASSVMCKKIASGAQAIVLDVKVGLGAFVKSVAQAEQLAQLMVDIGVGAGREMAALISNMDQPLGNAVGNALEVREAIETLRQAGPKDFREHCLEVAGHMLVLAKKAESLDQAKEVIAETLANGAALDRFRMLVKAQGGDVSVVDDPDQLPQARLVEPVAAPRSGYLKTIHAGEIGLATVALGAGRMKKGDPIDHAVGVVIHTKVGDQVEKGDPLFTVHANEQTLLEEAVARISDAHIITDDAVEPLPLFYRTFTA